MQVNLMNKLFKRNPSWQTKAEQSAVEARAWEYKYKTLKRKLKELGEENER